MTSSPIDRSVATHARWLFGIAAAFNFSIAASLLLFKPWVTPVLALDPIAGTNVVVANIAGLLIGLLGWAYFRVARDPVTYRPYVSLGIVGKLLAVAGATWPWLAGDIGWRVPLLASADLVFALLFVHFLRRTR